MKAIPTVIVSYNVSLLLEQCLKSVCQVEDLALEPWVVDNASSDGSADMVASRFPQAHLYRSKRNLGFAAGNNLALRDACSADYVLLLNPDTVVPRRGLQRLIDVAEQNPAIGAVGPQLISADGHRQVSWKEYPTPAGRIFDELSARRTSVEPCAKPARVDWIVGACMLIRGEWLRRVGVLDEDYFMYMEEPDWCRRLNAAGGQVWFCPDVQVVHHGEASVHATHAQAVTLNGLRVTDYLSSEFRYFSRYHGTGQALGVLAARTAITRGRLLKRSLEHELFGGNGVKLQECRELRRAIAEVWSAVASTKSGVKR